MLLEIAYAESQGFDEIAVFRMLERIETLLNAMVVNPQQCLKDLSILTETEKQQLLVKWNDTKAKYPKEKCIHVLFEEQVEKTPDAIAIVFEEQQLAYRELNDRANQLAHYLNFVGVKPEATVGICVERSLEMSIAILAVLKAGGAYVPIDPAYPTQRITQILLDAGVEILLTQQHLEAKLPLHQTRLINLDSSWSDIDRESTENCQNQAISENLAYVIYTSGSTGKPKGVAVTHTALVNYTLDIAEQFKLQGRDKVLQFASIGFDVVVEELFPTWIRGATVVLLENEWLILCTEFQRSIEKSS
ncbi:MAG: AMP-binding protein [Hydrococcus sp. RU_2_2]|nr:AMP-binding protein [Hydrococcus sp. RU_2_2]